MRSPRMNHRYLEIVCTNPTLNGPTQERLRVRGQDVCIMVDGKLLDGVVSLQLNVDSRQGYATATIIAHVGKLEYTGLTDVRSKKATAIVRLWNWIRSLSDIRK